MFRKNITHTIYFALPCLVLFLCCNSIRAAEILPINIPYNWRPTFQCQEGVNNTIGFWGLANWFPSGACTIQYNLLSMQQWNLPQSMYVFTKVHEHGHIANRNVNEEVTDCWATQQLAVTDPQILDQAINWVDNVLAFQADSRGITGKMRANWMRQCRASVATGPSPLPAPPIVSNVTTLPLDEGITEILSHANNKFLGIRGSLSGTEPSFRTYDSKIVLEDATRCRIMIDTDPKNGGSLTCRYNFDSLSDARDFEEELKNNLKSYLPADWTEGTTPDSYAEPLSEAERDIFYRKKKVWFRRTARSVVIFISGPSRQ